MDSDERKQFREQLHSWLRRHLPREDADLFYYHLGDLRDALSTTTALIEKLPSLDASSDATNVRKTLASLSGQLLEHIPAHTKEIEHGLLDWRDRLYSSAEERDEL